MQTFLPHPGFAASAAVLDDRRLGKQRVEAFQILRALTVPGYGWQHHPAVRMWRGFVPALAAYGHAVTAEWLRRGRADTVKDQLLPFTGGRVPDLGTLADRGRLPPWLGRPDVHRSHRHALRRKDPDWYAAALATAADVTAPGGKGADSDGEDTGYVWPRPPFPRWPLSRTPGDVEAAAAALEVPELQPEDASVISGVLAGRDAVAPMGSDESLVGLLAALATAGPTLWVTPCCPYLADADPAGTASTPADGATADDDGINASFVFLAAGRLHREPVLRRLAATPAHLVVVDGAVRLDEAGTAAVRTAVEVMGHPPVLELP